MEPENFYRAVIDVAAEFGIDWSDDGVIAEPGPGVRAALGELAARRLQMGNAPLEGLDGKGWALFSVGDQEAPADVVRAKNAELHEAANAKVAKVEPLVAKVLEIDCPDCLVTAGSGCVTRTGLPSPQPHSQRWRVASDAGILPWPEYDGAYSEVSCSLCGAPVGKVCLTGSGKPAISTHVARAQGLREVPPLPPAKTQPLPPDPEADAPFPAALVEEHAPLPKVTGGDHPGVLTVPCPACHALPGDACSDPLAGGQKEVRPHVVRHDAAWRADARA